MSLNVFKHLLPRADAWKMTTNKRLREFFSGLTVLQTNSKQFTDDVYLDINPATTRDIPGWESQFGLARNVTAENNRRARLLATWRAVGGQSPHYLQSTFQDAGFDVFIHEWWEPSSLPSTCPTPRDPTLYINDGTNAIQPLMSDGADTANDGSVDAVDGATIEPRGFLLVNKIQELSTTGGKFGDGDPCAVDGSTDAVDGAVFDVYTDKQYLIPTDPDKWRYFLYIGGETFPLQAQVPLVRKDEFETLCLKLCPTQQWLGMLIDYV